MKFRWLAIVAALAVFGACGGDDDESSDASPTGVETTVDDDSSDESVAPDDEADEADITVPDSEAADTTEAADEADASGAGCNVDVTGEFETSWDSPDDATAVLSDYWQSDEELKAVLDAMNQAGGGNVDVDAQIAEAEATGKPVLGLLLMNCSGPDGALVTFTHAISTTRSDLPFGPGTYAIAGGFLSGADVPANSILALASMPGEAQGDTIWGFDEEAAPGSLDITTWDNSTLEGTFTFPVTESLTDTPRKAVVSGTFAFSCTGSTTCG
jgi:hypothetical protein